MTKIKIILIGLLASFISGLTGLGGGIIIVPAMVYLLNKPQHISQGTALMTIFPIALINSFIYGLYKYLDFNLFILLSAGSIIGVLIGSTFAHNISEFKLRKIFGIYLIIASIKMIL
jgi:uncharacterized membrane protein YfcA